MAVRALAKGEGVASIAQLPLSDLEALADLTSRIPAVTMTVDESVERVAVERLRAESDPRVATQRVPSEDAVPEEPA